MGILQLYEADARGVAGNRVCPMYDCDSAEVAREINGRYTLTATLPRGAHYANEVLQGRAIKAAVNETGKEQYFIVRRRSRSLSGGLNIYAEHQSYYYNGVILGPGSANLGGSAKIVFTSMRTYAVPSITDLASWTYSRSNSLTGGFAARETPTPLGTLLKGWMIEAAGGELDFDGFAVTWKNQLGANNGAIYWYGANLTEMESEDIPDNYFSGIYPYWGRMTDQNRPIVILDNPVMLFSGTWPIQMIKPVDLTDQFDTQPTKAELEAAATAWMDVNRPSGIPTSIKVSRARIQGDTPVDLGDTVRVVNSRWAVDASTRICALAFDPLREKVKTVELGTVNPGFAGAVKNIK